MEIIFQRTKEGEEESLKVDATLTETPEFSSHVTEYPVEDGSIISDAVLRNPVRLTADAVVSNAPLDPEELGRDRVQEAFDILQELRELALLVRVVTKLKIYRDMVVTDISPPRDSSTGDALLFTISFQHIKKVASQSVEIPPEKVSAKKGKAPGAKEQAASKGDKGNQTGATPTAAEAAAAQKAQDESSEGIARATLRTGLGLGS